MRTAIWVLAIVLGAGSLIAQNSGQPSQVQGEPDTKQTPSTKLAENLLGELRDGIVGRNRDQIASAFDLNRMPDSSSLLGQIDQLFQRYGSFRVSYRLLQEVDEPQTSTAMVDFTLEATPYDDTQLPVRHSEQLRFTFDNEAQSWKIIDLQPRDFFSQF